ncbi:MAG: biotin transporter BioY [Tissierellia bacterium]|nr:biotin transporter BioY [Tissierellia bacterium]
MQARPMTRVALFAVLTFISGLISIPMGPVPITFQTTLVILTGLLLLPGEAFLAMGLHLLLKVFLQGGQILVTPSFGFLLGFILAAGLASFYLSSRPRTQKNLLVAILLASLLPYLVGLPYMAFILNGLKGSGLGLMAILTSGFFLFIPGDILKAVLAYVLAKRLYPLMGPAGEGRP